MILVSLHNGFISAKRSQGVRETAARFNFRSLYLGHIVPRLQRIATHGILNGRELAQSEEAAIVAIAASASLDVGALKDFCRHGDSKSKSRRQAMSGFLHRKNDARLACSRVEDCRVELLPHGHGGLKNLVTLGGAPPLRVRLRSVARGALRRNRRWVRGLHIFTSIERKVHLGGFIQEKIHDESQDDYLPYKWTLPLQSNPRCTVGSEGLVCLATQLGTPHVRDIETLRIPHLLDVYYKAEALTHVDSMDG